MGATTAFVGIDQITRTHEKLVVGEVPFKAPQKPALNFCGPNSGKSDHRHVISCQIIQHLQNGLYRYGTSIWHIYSHGARRVRIFTHYILPNDQRLMFKMFCKLG